MTKWKKDKAILWYEEQPWLVGCNFLPSSAINQLEMFQDDTFDFEIISKEVGWAQELGFNSLRVYLHDLLFDDPENLFNKLDIFLEICSTHSIKPILVLFDDCHRPDPRKGVQPLPVFGVHNSGWQQSPGMELVNSVFDETISESEIVRLEGFVKGVLERYKLDERILMWDLYNEPGQGGKAEKSLKLLQLSWKWAHSVRPSQPLTSCLDGSVGEEIIKLNTENSDIITFHTYRGQDLEGNIARLKEIGRPLICTEYMARELGTTFQFSLPIFKDHNIGCYNWGLVVGKSQTHFNWETVSGLDKKKEDEEFLQAGDIIPEPELWFHDILRKDGSAFDDGEVAFIKRITNA
ncbi:MAG: 1,4-beta-xylanase [Gammaproteobacteria bacterium]|nr:1,4-beta-xylanase [Gammaproteobacteria bacterium]